MTHISPIIQKLRGESMTEDAVFLVGFRKQFSLSVLLNNLIISINLSYTHTLKKKSKQKKLTVIYSEFCLCTHDCLLTTCNWTFPSNRAAAQSQFRHILATVPKYSVSFTRSTPETHMYTLKCKESYRYKSEYFLFFSNVNSYCSSLTTIS